MNILHIDSSLFADTSVSRVLTAHIVDALKNANPQASVVYRDLGVNPPAHLSASAAMAFRAGQIDGLTVAQRQEVEAIEQSLREIEQADVVVIGTPMYNFSVPSNLKAWIDQICQAGRTFRYTATGPEGLLQGRKVILASSRGGVHGDDDFQEAYLKKLFGFVGVTDVQVVRAEGVNLGEEVRSKAMNAANQQITERYASLR